MSALKNATNTELILIEKHKQNASRIAAEEVRRNRGASQLFENRVAYSVSEVAFMTGLSVRTVERVVRRGELGARRVGRRLLIPMTELEAWLNRKD